MPRFTLMEAHARSPRKGVRGGLAWLVIVLLPSLTPASPDSSPATQPAASRPAGYRPLARPTSPPASRPASWPTFRPASQPASRPTYHPKTQPASQPAAATQQTLDRQIRVRLLDEIPRVFIAADGAVDLVDADTGAVLGEARGGIGQVLFQPAGIRFSDLGVTLPAETIDVVPRGSGVLGISRTGRTERYPGTLRLLTRPSGAGAVVNLLDIEEYLPGVVAVELDPAIPA